MRCLAGTNPNRDTCPLLSDLGCPIDLDFNPDQPEARGYGWMLDDARPTLALTLPLPGPNTPVSEILIGMHDFYSGIDSETFRVVADFELEGHKAGENLAEQFREKSPGVWSLTLHSPRVAQIALATWVYRRHSVELQGSVHPAAHFS